MQRSDEDPKRIGVAFSRSVLEPRSARVDEPVDESQGLGAVAIIGDRDTCTFQLHSRRRRVPRRDGLGQQLERSLHRSTSLDFEALRLPVQKAAGEKAHLNAVRLELLTPRLGLVASTVENANAAVEGL